MVLYHIISYLVTRLQESAYANSSYKSENEDDNNSPPKKSENIVKIHTGINKGVEMIAKADKIKLSVIVYILTFFCLSFLMLIVLYGEIINSGSYPAHLAVFIGMFIFILVLCGMFEAIVVLLSEKKGYNETFGSKMV